MAPAASQWQMLRWQADEFDVVFRQRLHRLQQAGGKSHALGTRFLGEGAEGASRGDSGAAGA